MWLCTYNIYISSWHLSYMISYILTNKTCTSIHKSDNCKKFFFVFFLTRNRLYGLCLLENTACTKESYMDNIMEKWLITFTEKESLEFIHSLLSSLCTHKKKIIKAVISVWIWAKQNQASSFWSQTSWSPPCCNYMGNISDVTAIM